MKNSLNPIKKQNNELAITLETVPNYKFLLKTNFERSFEMQKSTFGEMEKEMEGIKRALRDTNPLFLALTFSVSLLHMVFEFLAFKNEIAFWKNKNDLHGLSVRTMFIELFSSVFCLILKICFSFCCR
ncbi:hypothetical protein MHBO_000412 [Bonamia ostreae]|uniref:Uncharacterized protein n=1 Tax=Bonamia ostreae TaxID=126728 RepID=A0ABV2AG52_9EUKA